MFGKLSLKALARLVTRQGFLFALLQNSHGRAARTDMETLELSFWHEPRPGGDAETRGTIGAFSSIIYLIQKPCVHMIKHARQCKREHHFSANPLSHLPESSHC